MRVTLAEEIRSKIADEILTGDLAAGQQLEEKALADRFSVSRAPIRDALRQLDGTGLVEVRPNRGVRVAPFDPAVLQELFEAQAEVEGVCARLMAMRAAATDRRQVQLLQAEGEECAGRRDEAGYAALDQRLHELIHAGTRNAVLAQTAASLRRRGAPFRLPVFYRHRDRMVTSCAEHGAIVDAILNVDPDAAGEAMREHLTNTSVEIIHYFEERERRA